MTQPIANFNTTQTPIVGSDEGDNPFVLDNVAVESLFEEGIPIAEEFSDTVEQPEDTADIQDQFQLDEDTADLLFEADIPVNEEAAPTVVYNVSSRRNVPNLSPDKPFWSVLEGVPEPTFDVTTPGQVQFKELEKHANTMDELGYAFELAQISKETNGNFNLSKTFEDFEGSTTLTRFRLGDLDTVEERVSYMSSEFPKYDFTGISTRGGKEVFFKRRDEETWYPFRNYEATFGDVAGFIGGISAESTASAVAQANPYLRSLGWAGRTIKETIAQGGGEALSQALQTAQGHQKETNNIINERIREAAVFGAVGEQLPTAFNAIAKASKTGVRSLSPYNKINKASKDAFEAAVEEGVDIKSLTDAMTLGHTSDLARVRLVQIAGRDAETAEKIRQGKEFTLDLFDNLRNKIDANADITLEDKINLYESVRDNTRSQIVLNKKFDAAKYSTYRESVIATGDRKALKELDNVLDNLKNKKTSNEKLGVKASETFLTKYVQPLQKQFNDRYSDIGIELRQYDVSFDLGAYVNTLQNDLRLQTREVLDPKGNLTTRKAAIAITNPKLDKVINQLKSEVESLNSPDVPNRIDLIQDHLNLLEPFAYPNDVMVKGARIDSSTQLARDLHKKLSKARDSISGVPDEVLERYKTINDEYSTFLATRDDEFAKRLVSSGSNEEIGLYIYNNLTKENLSLLLDTLPQQDVSEIIQSYKNNLIWGTDEISSRIRNLELNQPDLLDALFPNKRELTEIKVIGATADQFNNSIASTAIKQDLTSYEFATVMARNGKLGELKTIINNAPDPEKVKSMLRWGVLQDMFNASTVADKKGTLSIDTKKMFSRLQEKENDGMLDLLFNDNTKKSLFNHAKIMSAFDIAADSGTSLELAALASDLAPSNLLFAPGKFISRRIEILSTPIERRLYMSPIMASYIRNQIPPSPTRKAINTASRTLTVAVAPVSYRNFMESMEEREEFNNELKKYAIDNDLDYFDKIDTSDISVLD
jgi:hypothetical protein